MKVTLVSKTPASIAIHAIRMCHKSEDKSDSEQGIIGPKDEALIKRIIQMGHISTLEHISLTWEIRNITRACLQQLARHRTGKFSVESTRYTLTKVLKGEGNLEDYILDSGDPEVNSIAIDAIKKMKELAVKGTIPNDTLKYALPESYYTNLYFTIDLRNFKHFLELRLTKHAMKEIRDLAKEMMGIIIQTDLKVFVDDLGELYNESKTY